MNAIPTSNISASPDLIPRAETQAPFTRTDDAADTNVDAARRLLQTACAVSADGHATTTVARPPTVLLAEDDRSLRRYLEVALRRAGFSVVAAADGLEAMKLALSSEVDVVVTDSVMPHLGGGELCRFLKGHSTLKRLPVVLLSAQDLSGGDGLGPRADLYLPKPVGPEELAACLSRLLARAA